jgi:cysteine sulfinate desulfinase/cysteine desulfurase-like protein
MSRQGKLSAAMTSRARMSKADPERPLEVYDPIAAREQANAAAKRRLSDEMEQVFHEACRAGDLETAQGLLDILVTKLQRDGLRFSRERRLTEELVMRLTTELEESVKRREPT